MTQYRWIWMFSLNNHFAMDCSKTQPFTTLLVLSSLFICILLIELEFRSPVSWTASLATKEHAIIALYAELPFHRCSFASPAILFFIVTSYPERSKYWNNQIAAPDLPWDRDHAPDALAEAGQHTRGRQRWGGGELLFYFRFRKLKVLTALNRDNPPHEYSIMLNRIDETYDFMIRLIKVIFTRQMITRLNNSLIAQNEKPVPVSEERYRKGDKKKRAPSASKLAYFLN